MALIRLNRNPSRRQLRAFGLAWLAVLGSLGFAWHERGRQTAAAVAGALALAVPLAGWARPRLLRGIFIGLSLATYPIGLVVSHLVLALVYYFILTPIGFALRLCGHNPLARRFDRQAASYWERREEQPTAASYFRQN